MKIFSKGEYLGTKQDQKEIGGLLFSKTFYEEGMKSGWHYHENPYITIILRGGSIEKRRKNEIECKPGDVIFYNWQEVHKNQNYRKDSKNFNIEFEYTWFQKNSFFL